MERGIFSFIWRYSKGQQIAIIIMTALSLPFLYMLLDLPKYIVNDAIAGRDFPRNFLGFEFDQVEFLMLLCAGLLALLIINAVFSMVINTYKGVSSERLIRRLRYQLYQCVLRFPQRHFQKVTPPEISAMITAEVEPMADFVQDSFSMPMVQGGTMLTILLFMMVEDPILGVAAISMVPVQAYVIPKLQLKVNLLGRQRVIRARQLAGWVGESVLGINDIHTNDTSKYMQASISEKLGEIFHLRYQLYQKKFFMKALNVFLSQLTPLLFYSIGGVLIIQGDLSLGALVAVLGAYHRFTTPWKELLKYYQRYHDIKIKYEQLIEQFQPSEMISEQRLLERPKHVPRLQDPIDLRNVGLVEDGTKLLEDISLKIDPGEKVAIVTDPATKDRFANLIARTIDPTGGAIRIGEANLSELPEAVTGTAIGYAGTGSYIFSGTVEDNLLYGVKHAASSNGKMTDESDFFYKEAIASGNSVYTIDADWIDYESLGLSCEDDLNEWVLRVIHAVELDKILATRSLGMGLDAEKQPDLAHKLADSRKYIAEKINASTETAQLIRPFRFDLYNANASVAANLIFGEPVDDEFELSSLGSSAFVREVMDECKMTDRFLEIGHKLSETLIELFGDMSPDEQLFESFSFVDKDTLQHLKIVTTNINRDGYGVLKEDDRTLLISLTLQLIVDRHRFGFIDDDVQQRVVEARKTFRKKLPEDKRSAIAFFDQEGFNSQLTNRCNLLMGHVNPTISGAEQKTNEILLSVLKKQRIVDRMILLAIAYPVGVGGSRLSHSERQKIVLARSLIKKPDILVCNDALSAIDRDAQARIRRNIFDLLPNTTMIEFLTEPPGDVDFNQVITVREGRISDEGVAPVIETARAEGASPTILNSEASALSKIPLFSRLGQKHLKLLALSSHRIEFAKGDDLIRQGERGENAYLILDGEVDILIGKGKKQRFIRRYGKNILVGELSLLTDTLTTATVRAVRPVSALRIGKDTFLQLMESDAAVASQVAAWVSDRLVKSMEMINKAA
jgi:putative ABC transport system ATP-binding protein